VRYRHEHGDAAADERAGAHVAPKWAPAKTLRIPTASDTPMPVAKRIVGAAKPIDERSWPRMQSRYAREDPSLRVASQDREPSRAHALTPAASAQTRARHRHHEELIKDLSEAMFAVIKVGCARLRRPMRPEGSSSSMLRMSFA
jgi:hypothetical protein